MNSFLVSLVVLPFVSLAEVTGFDTNVACPADGSKDCSKAKCCATAGDKCYQKNNWWASCKPICTKGIDPADPPKYQQPWTCKVLGTGPPAGDCPKDGSESCLAQKCCATPGQKCYMKNNYWAACMDSCTPGINPLDPPKHQSPWSCKVVGSGPPPAPPAPPPPPPAPEPKPPAPEPSPPPAATRRRRRAAKKPAGTAVHRRRRRSGAVARRRRRRRRRSSGLKLHRRRRRSTTGGLASLRRRRSSGPSPAPKPPPVAISRRRRSPRPSPRPVSSIRRRRARPAPRPAPPPSAPEPAPRPGCSAPGEDCRSTKCCTDPGEACYEKSKYWGGCKESCTPGIDPNDPPEYQDPWSCRLLGDPPIPGLRRRRSDPAPAPSPSGGGGGGGGGSKKSGKKIKGHLTMWAMNDALIGSQCEYANAPVGSTTDPMLPSYLRTGFHCAIGDANPGFGKGEHCGKCYELVSTSDRGTGGTPGKKGSAIVTVSNGGAGGPAHFDCIMESFEAITGARTGIFDVTFEEVTCDEIKGGPVVINWADKNAYYCKMMFENIGGWGQLESVEGCLNGNKCQKMQLFAGATWTGCPGGTGSSMSFKLTQKTPAGKTETITCNCAGSWPWNTGKRCTCPTNFKGL